MPPPPTHSIPLPGGRVVTCGEFGAPDGHPLLYFHGFPSSQAEAELIDETGRELGLRVLSLDRPGTGGSTFVPGRQMLDWPRDVAAVADALGVGRFILLGVSGGCPYALTCGREMPDRIAALGIVCGLGPVYRPELRTPMRWPARLSFGAAGRGGPWLDALYGGPLGWLLSRRPEALMLLLLVACPAADKEVLRERLVRRALRRGALGALGPGTRGLRHELRIYAHPWGYELSEVRLPVRLWHGTDDATVPLAHGELLARELPQAELTIAPGEGHFSLPVRQRENILRELRDRARL